MNGKYCGAGMIVNPYGCMNDGLLDICWTHDEGVMNLAGTAGILDKAKKQGGLQAYDKTLTFMRGKKARFAYRGMLGKSMPAAGWGN